MERKEVLKNAGEIIAGIREDHYGKPEDNFQRIATMWNTYLDGVVIGRDASGSLIGLTPKDVAAMMILLKVARLAHTNNHDDSWIDIAGYAALGGEV